MQSRSSFLPFSRAAILASLAFAGAASTASSAHADDRAAARPLFDEGRRLMKEGKVAEACAKFEAASHLTTTAGVRLNLAGCWAKLGHTASAWGMYDEARALAERSGDTAAAELAQKGKAELEPKLSRLVVAVASGNAVGLTVTRDSEPVYSGAWGVGVPVDPGEHEISAQAPGHKAWSTKTTVSGEGTSTTVTVPVLDADTPNATATKDSTTQPQTTTTTPPPETSSGSSRGSGQRIAGLVVGGVGIVGLGIGAVFTGITASDKSQYQSNEKNGKCINAQCATDSQSAVSAGNVATAFWIGGAVLAAAGTVIFLTAPKAHENTATVRFVPAIGLRSGGLALEGTW